MQGLLREAPRLPGAERQGFSGADPHCWGVRGCQGWSSLCPEVQVCFIKTNTDIVE